MLPALLRWGGAKEALLPEDTCARVLRRVGEEPEDAA